MRKLWEQAGLEAVDTRVIRIPIVYLSFDDFWDSDAVPVGPQGKLIEAMPASVREKLRAYLRERLPIAPDGHIAYDSFANAVRGQVPR